MGGDNRSVRKFKRYPIGYFHIDIAEVHTEKAGFTSSWRLIGPPSSPSPSCTRWSRAGRRQFLRALAAPFPTRSTPCSPITARISPSRPVNTGRRRDQSDARARRCRSAATPSRVPGADLDMSNRLTKPRHPWTNGQVERMNRTIKDATVKRFHYDATISSGSTSRTSWRLQLRPPPQTLRASHPTKLSAKPGWTSPLGSLRTRTTKSRDQTSKLPRLAEADRP